MVAQIFALELWELLSAIVTVIGLPFAIGIFMYEQRKERANEEAEIYQRLTDEYADFLKLLLENADLRLASGELSDAHLTAEQQERKRIIFDLLVSVFERAYILVYEEKMAKRTRRMWSTWEDYMRFWCRRADFRALLPELLPGEDPEFVAYIQTIAEKEARKADSPVTQRPRST